MAEFDQYEPTYKDNVQKSIDFSGLDVDFFMQAKAVHLLAATSRLLGDPSELSFLDVGCGIGLMGEFLRDSVGAVSGVDMSAKSIETAQANLPGIDFKSYDGSTIPHQDNTFDVTFAVNVMHHVPPAEWLHFLKEMKRVVKPGGLIFIFEHNKFNPVTLHIVNNCPMDDNAVLVTKSSLRRLLKEANLPTVDSRYILFFPWKHKIFLMIESFIRFLPLGAQHYVASRKL